MFTERQVQEAVPFLEGGFIFLKLVEVSAQPDHIGGALSVLGKCPVLPAGVLYVRRTSCEKTSIHPALPL